jgi:hypothetical protein
MQLARAEHRGVAAAPPRSVPNIDRLHQHGNEFPRAGALFSVLRDNESDEVIEREREALFVAAANQLEHEPVEQGDS